MFQCWDHMLSTLVETSQIQADMSIDERRQLAQSGWAMKKVNSSLTQKKLIQFQMEHYNKLFDDLPEETKNDFEKVWTSIVIW